MKDSDKDNDKPSSGGGMKDFTTDVPKDEKTIKCSTTDPESGWFRKGEHKHVFAYSIETACDKFGWILGYSVNPGNMHDKIHWLMYFLFLSLLLKLSHLLSQYSSYLILPYKNQHMGYSSTHRHLVPYSFHLL